MFVNRKFNLTNVKQEYDYDHFDFTLDYTSHHYIDFLNYDLCGQCKINILHFNILTKFNIFNFDIL